MNDLGMAGRELVAALRAELGGEYEFDAREAELVDVAARLADRMADLEEILAEDGLRLVTKTGVVRIHPAVAEYRQQAVALARVLSAVALPAPDGGQQKSAAKVRAAEARWRRRGGGEAA